MLNEQEIMERLETLKSLILYAKSDLASGKFEEVRKTMEAEIFMYIIEFRTLCTVIGKDYDTEYRKTIFNYVAKGELNV